MARTKFASPTLDLQITPEQHERAIKSASGGCLIADAIKEQYPQFSGVTVDMATIRVSERKTGKRFTYLTPPSAQHLLLSFDQGWPQSTERIMIKRAVKITPIRTASSRKKIKREARKAELEAKVAAGEPLTRSERASLTKLQKELDRPVGQVPAEVKVTDNRGTVVYGGQEIPQGPAHPNLLRGRDRHFGAKLADPGDAFREAVDAAVAERLAQADDGSKAV